MPRPQYDETRRMRAAAAWDLLCRPEWEIAERLPNNTVIVGTPRLFKPSGCLSSGESSRLEPGARPGHTGVREQIVPGEEVMTVSFWCDQAASARSHFDEKLSSLIENEEGPERLVRLDLILAGEVQQVEYVMTGIVTPRAELDSLSLTYVGVVLSIGFTIAFGLGGHWYVRAIAGLIAMAAVIKLTRFAQARDLFLSLAAYALRQR